MKTGRVAIVLCLLGCSSATEIVESDAEPAINIVVNVKELIANSLRSRFLLQSFCFSCGAVLVGPA